MPFWKKQSNEKKLKFVSRELKSRSTTESSKSAERVGLYQSLTAIQDFRLVELLPGSVNDPIRCRLKLASLAERPLYTAISYRCGDEGPIRAVWLNDYMLSVRPNLFDLLVQLRHGSHKQTLWIDALCINQFDLEERSSQVKLMANIFASAVRVIACLRDYLVKSQQGSYAHGLVSDSLRANIADQILRFSDRLAIFTAFFNHEYWHRRWIVQEIALAQSVTIFCGGKTMPLARVKNMAEDWGHKDSLAMRLCLMQESDAKLKSTLPDLLSIYQATACEDFRDKVFALLSLVDGADKDFQVSYNMTRAELLVATIEFSSALQHLDPKSTIRFALAFGKELGMSEADHPKPDTNGTFIGHEWVKRYTSPIASIMFQRGSVFSTSLSPELHETVCRWRDCLNPLTGIASLRFFSANSGQEFVYQSKHSYLVPGDSEKISPQDMHAFTWLRQASTAMNSDGACLGFATARVERSDCIYQFPTTRVALVIRFSGRAFSIIARALLMPADFALTGRLVSPQEARPWEPASSVNNPPDIRFLYTVGCQTLDLARLASGEF